MYGKNSNYWPPLQSLGLWFSECWQKWNFSIGLYEKIEKWPPFHKYQSYGNISNYWPRPKVWVSGFLSVDRNGLLVLAIMKKLKNGHHFVNISHMEKCQITHPPPRSLGLWFSKCWWKRNIEKWPPLCNIDHTEKSYRKISNYQSPPKFGSPVFWVSMEMEYQCQLLWKNWKMAVVSYQWKTGDMNFLLVQFSEFSICSVFPITHPRFSFNIYVWLCLNIYAWTFMHGDLSALVKSLWFTPQVTYVYFYTSWYFDSLDKSWNGPMQPWIVCCRCDCSSDYSLKNRDFIFSGWDNLCPVEMLFKVCLEIYICYVKWVNVYYITTLLVIPS